VQLDFKTIFWSILIAFFISGCSTKEVAPTNVQEIQKQKQAVEKNEISISSGGEIYFKMYLNKEYAIRFLCYKNEEALCNYYEESKHSYINDTIEEEMVYINEKGYSPMFSIYAKKIQCGKGNLLGYPVLLMPSLMKNHNNDNPEVCNSIFSKVHSTQLATRIIWGSVTFLTPFLSGGTMHTRVFDEDEFRKAIFVSNIDSFKEELIKKAKEHNLEGGLDIVYLKQGGVKLSLENKIDELLLSKSKKGGVVFLEEKSGKLLSIIIFKQNNKHPSMKKISLQIEELLEDISNNRHNFLEYEKIEKYVPEPISFPVLPLVPNMVKSEYEKIKEFEKRVEEAVEARESEIRNLQREYSLKIVQRNKHIDYLQQSYEKYVNDYMQNKKSLYFEIKKELPLLTKVLFLENTSGYDAKKFSYDAEEERLFFTIHSKNGSYKQAVFSEMKPKFAQQIKEQKSFKIIPKIEVEKQKLTLKGFDILETSSNSLFLTQFTNINFKPQEMAIEVKTEKEQFEKHSSNKLAKYKQKDESIVDKTQKEFWYVQVANRVNAKVPLWFSTPAISENICGYGEANSLEDAKMNARKDLVHQLHVKVDATYENRKIIGDAIQYEQTIQSTKQTSAVELKASDYKTIRQEQKDGRWYVALEYLKN